MITLKNDQLTFSFPEVHAEAVFSLEFERTLRIPDDNRAHFLPPGLGSFPLAHVDDHAARLPPSWRAHGGVFLPMYQAEALWINFNDFGEYPFAVKIAAGKIDAVTGDPWSTKLSDDPQNYVVVPEQPWLDGFCVSKGMIRQFVAMPLGAGFTAEEQLTGAAEHGGLQIIAYPMKAEVYEAMRKARAEEVLFGPDFAMCCEAPCPSPPQKEMGLAPGGLMRQSIYDDPYGLDAWDLKHASRCFVHILNSLQYAAATGHNPPTRPPSAADYTRAGLPWFAYYGAESAALEGSAKLAGMDSVAAKTIKQGLPPLPENEPVTPKVVIPIGTGGLVREAEF